MHVIFRESRGLEETEVATDLGQSPAPLIVLSFSDSDLGLSRPDGMPGAIICLNCVWPIWRR
jgi:hypothetical protein